MKLCFYCTSGRDFKTFDYKVIYNFKFNMINYDLILTDTCNVICCNKEAENYSTEFINIFLNKYPFGVEIYDD